MTRVIPFNPVLPSGLAVEVYWNLHKHVFSVRDRKTGLVVGHCTDINLMDVKFKVFENRRQTVIREKRKNVHAFVRGTVSPDELHLRGLPSGYTRARYNPYESGSFMDADTGVPLAGAEFARLMVLGDAVRGGTILLCRAIPGCSER